MRKGLFAFFLSATVAALIAVLVLGPDWNGLFSTSDEIPAQSTFTPTEVEKIIIDWPIALAEVDKALKQYRNVGGSRSGEAAIRKGVQTNVFKRKQWPEGRAEHLISYLFMLRNSLLKYSDQHRALGYFMEHYEHNDAVSAELKAWQIDQIGDLLKQVNDAPDLTAYPPGDVELMSRYFERFHQMLLGYGRSPGFASQVQAGR